MRAYRAASPAKLQLFPVQVITNTVSVDYLTKVSCQCACPFAGQKACFCSFCFLCLLQLLGGYCSTSLPLPAAPRGLQRNAQGSEARSVTACCHAARLHRLRLRAARASGSSVEVDVVTRVCTPQVAWQSWASAIAAFPPKVCSPGMCIKATFVAPPANPLWYAAAIAIWTATGDPDHAWIIGGPSATNRQLSA